MDATVIATLVAAATSAGNRIYPLKLPREEPLPAAVYTRVATSPVTSLCGYSGKDGIRVQIDCYGKSYEDAKRLAAEIRVAMTSLKSLPVNEADLYEDEVDLPRVMLEFSVWN